LKGIILPEIHNPNDEQNAQWQAPTTGSENLDLIQEQAQVINDEVDRRRKLKSGEFLSNTELALSATAERKEAADRLSRYPELQERFIQTYRRETFGPCAVYLDPKISPEDLEETQELLEILGDSEKTASHIKQMYAVLPAAYHLPIDQIKFPPIFIHSPESMRLFKDKLGSSPEDSVQLLGRASSEPGKESLQLMAGSYSANIFTHELTHHLQPSRLNLYSIAAEGFADLTADRLEGKDMLLLRAYVSVGETKKLIDSGISHPLADSKLTEDGRVLIDLSRVLTPEAQRIDNSRSEKIAANLAKYHIPTLFLDWYKNIDPSYKFVEELGYHQIESMARFIADHPEKYGEHREDLEMIASPLCMMLFPRNDPTVSALENELSRRDISYEESLARLLEFASTVRPRIEEVTTAFNAYLNYSAKKAEKFIK
jgi:hypothetical protein